MGNKPEPYSSMIWRKSRRSADQGNCVEVTVAKAAVLVRDSNDRAGLVIEISSTHWKKLLGRVRNGDLGGR
jgi:hypothetical protein